VWWLRSGFSSGLQVHQFLASARRIGWVQRVVEVSPTRRASGMESSISSPNKALQRTCLPGHVCISHFNSTRGNQAAKLVRWAKLAVSDF